MRTIDDLVRERTPKADDACFVRQEPLAAYLARGDHVSASMLRRAAQAGGGARAARIEEDPAQRLAQALHALVLEPARFAREYLVLDDEAAELTAAGTRFLADLGVELPARRSARHFCRLCLDWTERRHHISGAVGAALADAFLARRLVERIPDSRALSVTPLGRKTLAAMGVAEYLPSATRSANAG